MEMNSEQSNAAATRQFFEAHLDKLRPWMNKSDIESIIGEDQCYDAFALSHTQLPSAIFNHCARVYIYAQRTAYKSFPTFHCAFRDYADIPSSKFIYMACMLHDIGATPEYDGEQRFEIEGADAAVKVMQGHGASQAQLSSVWEAIALHTTPGISERISPMALCVRLGVTTDFLRPNNYEDELEMERLRTEVERVLPRLDIEKVLGDAVVSQAVAKPAKAPKASWPWCLLVAHQADPTHEGVNRAF
jgi:hypothetical protein